MFLYNQEAQKTCENVEIRYCAVEPLDKLNHAKRHRRGSLQSPSPTSPEVHVGVCQNPSSPAKAFVKINNKPTNDWKVYYSQYSSVKPVIKRKIDFALDSKPMTGFSCGVCKKSVFIDPSNRDRPLSACRGTKVVTRDGIFVDGQKRTVDVPQGAEEGIKLFQESTPGTILSIEIARHPKTDRKVTAFKVGGIPVYYFSNTEEDMLVPCLDMADDRIRSLKAEAKPSHKGLCVDTDDNFVYTNPEEKVDDFRREAGKPEINTCIAPMAIPYILLF